MCTLVPRALVLARQSAPLTANAVPPARELAAGRAEQLALTTTLQKHAASVNLTPGEDDKYGILYFSFSLPNPQLLGIYGSSTPIC